MQTEDKFLPIGTVVLLKGGKKEVMIITYCVFPEGKLYEYGACTYPEGVIEHDTIIGFNHDQIEKVCHMGYETDDQKGFATHLDMVMQTLKNEVLKGQEQA